MRLVDSSTRNYFGKKLAIRPRRRDIKTSFSTNTFAPSNKYKRCVLIFTMSAKKKFSRIQKSILYRYRTNNISSIRWKSSRSLRSNSKIVENSRQRESCRGVRVASKRFLILPNFFLLARSRKEREKERSKSIGGELATCARRQGPKRAWAHQKRRLIKKNERAGSLDERNGEKGGSVTRVKRSFSWLSEVPGTGCSLFIQLSNKLYTEKIQLKSTESCLTARLFGLWLFFISFTHTHIFFLFFSLAN